jgi:hypothetical protein
METIQESAFIDFANQPFGTTIPIGSATFTAPGQVKQVPPIGLSTFPFSLTEQYVITAIGGRHQSF